MEAPFDPAKSRGGGGGAAQNSGHSTYSVQESPWGVVGHVSVSLLFKCLICIWVERPFDPVKSGGHVLIKGHRPIQCRGLPGELWVT